MCYVTFSAYDMSIVALLCYAETLVDVLFNRRVDFHRVCTVCLHIAEKTTDSGVPILRPTGLRPYQVHGRDKTR